VRFLLVNNHCVSDPTAGVAQSLRTIIEWLADAGHGCQVLTTARFESAVTFTIEEHLTRFGVDVPSRRPAVASGQSRKRARLADVPVIDYTVRDVPVTLLMTRHNDETRPNRAEAAQFTAAFNRLLHDFGPDQVIACNGHPMIRTALADARGRGITTAFAVRGFWYYEARYFADVDHAFTCSQFLTDHYRDKIGLFSTPIEPPIDWSTVVAPEDARAFVTFVHPAPHKGLLLFARLADMLGSRRPDIPILVVQSGQSGGALNTIAEFDFSRYPQIMAAPAVPAPADYFALTRVLLVPSVWEEPFGRVAAEAMINGVPAVVSDRGALANVIGGEAGEHGGLVVEVPADMTPSSTHVPSEAQVEPWYNAVCQLWDDKPLYARFAANARKIAANRYSETVSRARHVSYFTSLRPGARPLQ
jgi:glycosyltransferase involved in cell wall biosynthesis